MFLLQNINPAFKEAVGSGNPIHCVPQLWFYWLHQSEVTEHTVIETHPDNPIPDMS